MSQLVLHAKTQQELAAFLGRPTHALLLTGPAGSGKQTVALWLAGQLLGIEAEALPNYPYFLLADTLTPSISIDTVRQQQHFLRLKTLGDKPIRRVLALQNVERMTTEAQNAFLKTLEEPPADTVLLLTSARQQELLPTILSRVQLLTVRPPNEAAVKEYFGAHHSKAAIDRAYLLSAGLPGLMAALLKQDALHPLVAAVQQAKSVLQATTFERLAMVDGLGKQKAETAHLLQALKQIAQTGVEQAAKQQDQARLGRWHRSLKAAQSATTALEKSANPKLVLTNLMLSL